MKITEIRRLRRTIRSFDRLTSRQIKRSCCGVSVSQCHALLEMEAQGKTTTLRLTRELKLDKSTVSLTVDKLVKLGMVSRVPDRDDRRVTQLELTKKGQTVCRAINKSNDDYIARVFQHIPSDRRKAVIDDFALLVEAIAEHEEVEA